MMLRIICFVEEVLSRLMIAVVATSVFINVVSRYFFSKAIPWAEEVAAISMVWAVYVGAAIGIRKRFHIRILVLIRLMPRTAALGTVIIGDILFLVFCAIMLWFGYEFLSLLWQREFRSPSLRIHQFYPQSVVAIGYLLIVVHTFVGYIDWWRSGYQGLPGIDEVEGTTAALSGNKGES